QSHCRSAVGEEGSGGSVRQHQSGQSQGHCAGERAGAARRSVMSAEPTLKLKFISHGTLECRDLAFTRRFYEEFLGFEVVQTSKISIWSRRGGNHVLVCVQSAEKKEMGFLGHNGIDVASDAEVDECHRLVEQHAEQWKLHKISKPVVQHGSYSFYFWDADDN